jgi:sulfur-oxidizing protein SoxY
LLLTLASIAPAKATMTEVERAQRWDDLSHALFGDRAVKDGNPLLHIEAADRAENAALVPVALHVDDPLAAQVQALYFVIDNNPSPLAAVFHFGPVADRHDIATRVRIDDYTYLHAIAETADGSLYVAERFIKAAGGCSAPAGNDPALALQRLGKMKITLAPRESAAQMVSLLISHPNSSGLQMDQVTRNYIPADFIEKVHVSFAGTPVLDIDGDIALSEDPNFRFALKAAGAGEITVDVDDSNQRHFSQSWPVPAATE